LIAGLSAAYEIAPNAEVLVRADSKLVCEQMSGHWKIKKGSLIDLARQAGSIFPTDNVTYEWVPREKNSRADTLANEAMDNQDPEIVRDYPSNLTPIMETELIAAAELAEGAPVTAAQTAQSATSSSTTAVAAPKASGSPAPSAFTGLDPTACLTLSLVRHGVTEHTSGGKLAGGGTPGAPLSKVGLRMAKAAGLALQQIHEIWADIPAVSEILASPMIRTQQTAAQIGARLGLPIRTDPRLREIEFGDWHELTMAEIEQRWPGQPKEYFKGTFRPPNGESYFDTAQREAPVVAELLRTHIGANVAIVSHAVAIRAILGPALGLAVENWARLRIPPCSLSIVRIWPDANGGEGTTEITCMGVPTTTG